MILPTKHIKPDRSLLGIGAEILTLLSDPKTVSGLWNDFKKLRADTEGVGSIGFEWFILAIDFLFIVDSIEYIQGRLVKVTNEE